MSAENTKKLNFAFFGTPNVASETLELLRLAGYTPSLIVTSPDARSGRKMLLTPPPAKTWAINHNIPFLQPEKLDGDFSAKLALFNPELSIVVAYGKIMPENIINLPRLGSINIHYSLLPKYRGASPVESAILNGDVETGVTIQQMEFKMDAGDILAQEKTNILPEEKTPDLRQRLILIGANLLIKILPDLIEQKIKASPQNELDSSHCKKIKKEAGLVDLDHESSRNLFNKFRAYAIWPRTYFFKNGKRFIITQAKIEHDKFIIEKVIPEGGSETTYTG